MSEIETMFSDVLEEIAEAQEAPTTFINNDSIAEWAVRKIKDEQQECDRLTDVIDNSIEYYREKKEAIKRKYERRISNLTENLAEYFATVPHRQLKASEQYALPSGKLTMKYGKTKQRYVDASGNDDNGEQLIAWLEAYGYLNFVKYRKEVNWSALKEAITANGDDFIMNDTGEIIEGIKAYKTDDEFEVK